MEEKNKLIDLNGLSAFKNKMDASVAKQIEDIQTIGISSDKTYEELED